MVERKSRLDTLVSSPARQRRDIDEGVGAWGAKKAGGGLVGEFGEGNPRRPAFGSHTPLSPRRFQVVDFVPLARGTGYKCICEWAQFSIPHFWREGVFLTLPLEFHARCFIVSAFQLSAITIIEGGSSVCLLGSCVVKGDHCQRIQAVPCKPFSSAHMIGTQIQQWPRRERSYSPPPSHPPQTTFWHLWFSLPTHLFQGRNAHNPWYLQKFWCISSRRRDWNFRNFPG